MNRKMVFATTFACAIILAILVIPALGMPSEDVMQRNRNFVAHLSGKVWTSRVNSTVTYAIDTRAQGEAIFHLSKDGTTIEFMLIAANIQNITMAHIHIDNGEALGPIVVWLYPRSPPPKEIPGRFDGVLAKGTINATDLTGPFQGMTIKDLMAKMETGFAYVVIHTSQHPPGEIRGFIH